MTDRRAFMAALAVLSLPSIAQALDAQATPSALADIRAAAVNHPGWLYISRRCTDAQDLAALCRLHGWTSVQEVIRFADLMGKTFSAGEVMAMTPNSAPAIDRAALPVVQWGPGNAPIHSAIQQAFRTAIVPDQSDRTYRALTHAQIVALANAYRPRRAREDTTMDCDDYTRGYLGWLAENGYGNCSHGFLGYQAYDAFGRHLGAHAVTVSVDVDRRVWMVDHMPGSVGVWPAPTVRLGGFTTAARIEPTRVSFEDTMADPKPNHRTILRLLPSGQVVPTPRRIECEPLDIHEARCAAVKKLGVKWVMHPAYVFDPRHSNDPEVYGPARAQFLAAIGYAAAADRRRNPAFQQAERVRAVIGGVA